MDIIEQAIGHDKAAFMNRVHHVAKESRNHAETTASAMAREAAIRRHDSACELLNNLYWEDVAAIERDVSQLVIAQHEARRVLAL